MLKYKANLEDPLEYDSLTVDISGLATAYSEWETEDGNGTRKLWSVLGSVYQLGPRIDRNGSVKLDLIEQVKADPNVQASSKWNPANKSAHELLLVKLLSIKPETKAKKSQWFSAIRSAKKERIEPDQSSFVSFLEKVGGIDKARKLHAKTTKLKPTFDELVQVALNLVNPDFHKISIPTCFGDAPELPGEIGLVIVHGERAGGKAVPIATIADPALIAKAIVWTAKQHDAIEADQIAEFSNEARKAFVQMKAAKRKIQARYRDAIRNDIKTVGTFAEFVWEQFDEDEDWSVLKDRWPAQFEQLTMTLTER